MSVKNICDCYHTVEKIRYLYDIFTGERISAFPVMQGVCWGTRECDEVECNGDRHCPECIYYEDHRSKFIGR